MSYTKTNWQTGDVITAQKLNNAEAGILAGQNGYGYQEVWTTIYDNTIAQSDYYETAGLISKDLHFTNETGLYDSSDDNWNPYPKIRVTINGVSTILEQNEDAYAPSYGRWHYDESTGTNVFDDPCEISYHTYDNVYYLFVPDDTEREVKVEIPEKSMVVSDEFIAAVDACPVHALYRIQINGDGDSVPYYIATNITTSKMEQLYRNGAVLAIDEPTSGPVVYLTNIGMGMVSINYFYFSRTYIDYDNNVFHDITWGIDKQGDVTRSEHTFTLTPTT